MTSIFISYNWKSVTEVELVEHVLISAKLQVSRDVRDIGIGESIENYMESIMNHQYVIMIVSDEYMKSLNCMYEAILALKSKRTILCYSNIAQLYSADYKKSIHDYWHKYSCAHLPLDIKKYKYVLQYIDVFLSFITNINDPSARDINTFVAKVLQKIEADKFINDSNFEDLRKDLKFSKYIQIAEFPEVPFLEKRYKYDSFRYLPSTYGLNIVLTLKEENSNKLKDISIPNVCEIEKGNEGIDFSKYYFKCINMTKFREQKEQEYFGKKLDNTIDIYERVRIIISF